MDKFMEMENKMFDKRIEEKTNITSFTIGYFSDSREAIKEDRILVDAPLRDLNIVLLKCISGYFSLLQKYYNERGYLFIYANIGDDKYNTLYRITCRYLYGLRKFEIHDYEFRINDNINYENVIDINNPSYLLDKIKSGLNSKEWVN